MFDLEQEVHAWCQDVHRRGPGRLAHVEELEDHLLCEVQRLEDQGHGQREAFERATQKLGARAALSREHAKNTNLVLALTCRLRDWEQRHLERWRRSLSPKRVALLQLVVALAFASAILIAAFLLRGKSYADVVTYSLIAIWWIPFSVLTAIGSAPVRCRGKRST